MQSVPLLLGATGKKVGINVPFNPNPPSLNFGSQNSNRSNSYFGSSYNNGGFYNGSSGNNYNNGNGSTNMFGAQPLNNNN